MTRCKYNIITFPSENSALESAMNKALDLNQADELVALLGPGEVVHRLSAVSNLFTKIRQDDKALKLAMLATEVAGAAADEKDRNRPRHTHCCGCEVFLDWNNSFGGYWPDGSVYCWDCAEMVMEAEEKAKKSGAPFNPSRAAKFLLRERKCLS